MLVFRRRGISSDAYILAQGNNGSGENMERIGLVAWFNHFGLSFLGYTSRMLAYLGTSRLWHCMVGTVGAQQPLVPCDILSGASVSTIEVISRLVKMEKGVRVDAPEATRYLLLLLWSDMLTHLGLGSEPLGTVGILSVSPVHIYDR
jgi:hypothetical protein